LIKYNLRRKRIINEITKKGLRFPQSEEERKLTKLE
jgi:hypothetical protein